MLRKSGYALSVLLCVVLTGIPLQSRAETLDDASIRKFYAESTAIMRDTAKLQPFMEQRLDENFTLQSNSTQILNGGPPQTSTSNTNKTQTIASTIQSVQTMSFETLDNKIASIKYSDDHKYAYVTDSTTSTGTVKVPAANGTVTARYEDGDSCVDRLALEGTLITLMQSACNDRLAITK